MKCLELLERMTTNVVALEQQIYSVTLTLPLGAPGGLFLASSSFYYLPKSLASLGLSLHHFHFGFCLLPYVCFHVSVQSPSPYRDTSHWIEDPSCSRMARDKLQYLCNDSTSK